MIYMVNVTVGWSLQFWAPQQWLPYRSTWNPKADYHSVFWETPWAWGHPMLHWRTDMRNACDGFATAWRGLEYAILQCIERSDISHSLRACGDHDHCIVINYKQDCIYQYLHQSSGFSQPIYIWRTKGPTILTTAGHAKAEQQVRTTSHLHSWHCQVLVHWNVCRYDYHLMNPIMKPHWASTNNSFSWLLYSLNPAVLTATWGLRFSSLVGVLNSARFYHEHRPEKLTERDFIDFICNVGALRGCRWSSTLALLVWPWFRCDEMQVPKETEPPCMRFSSISGAGRCWRDCSKWGWHICCDSAKDTTIR